MKGAIEQFQNADGGWPYGIAGSSWTEPTVFALLAQIALGKEASAAVQRGLRWLETVEAGDGGWRPEAKVQESTWVGALVALLPGSLIPEARRSANLKWLLAQTGQESTLLYRIRQWMIGNSTGTASDGWPWFPGASAWVTPTALTVLALRKHQALLAVPNSLLDRRIEEGQQFLLGHACASGGWNHGGAQALGYQAYPYPETTGLALLALHGKESPVKEAGLRTAERFLPVCRSAEAIGWLTLGLRANGCSAELPVSAKTEARTIVDLALLTMADRAGAGMDPFLP